MLQGRGQLDEFDRLMLEVGQAQRAGVFGSTPMDVEALMEEPAAVGPVHWYRHVLVGLPLAACIAMFFGVATLWQAGSRTENGIGGGTISLSTLTGTSVASTERCDDLESFRTCFQGPELPVDPECRCVDFDGDGDVDLRDAGFLQMSRTLH